MLRASFIGLLVTIVLNFVLVLLVSIGGALIGGLIPGFAGGLIAGFIAKRGFLGGAATGGLLALLLSFWMIAIATGIGIPPMYEAVGEFPGLVTVMLSIVPAAGAAVAGGFAGGLLLDLLPRVREDLKKRRSGTARVRYYSKR